MGQNEQNSVLGNIQEQLGGTTPLTQPEVVATPESIAEIEGGTLPQVAPQPAPPAPPVEEDTTPNVRLAPSASEDKVLGEGTHVVGRTQFEVPDAQAQADGFYVRNPEVFVAHYRQFKFITEKGENAPSVQI